MKHSMTRIAPALLLSILALAGCKTGDSTESLPNTGTPSSGGNYSGPPPATDDVQNFKLAVWDNLVSTDRCGGCHSTGGQSPMFVHADDINTAYAQANTVVNLNDPGQSLMVSKVAGGHNCWLSSDQACADTITSYIEGWSGNSAGAVKRIELKAPAIKDPGATKSFPETSTGFANYVYPTLVTYCSACHIEGIQTPYIASDNVDQAYAEAQSRINLQVPASSRLVERLRNDFHNCWADDCELSAEMMQVAIEDYAASISTDPVDPDLVTSKALTLLGDGLVANAGGRYEDNAIALYEFKAGTGYTAFDTSGVEPALHLNLTGNVQWVGGWGIAIGGAYEDEETGATVPNGKAQGNTSASRKLHNLLTASGEFSIEAWIVPGNTTQEDARIISYSGASTARNVTLSQFQQNYEVLLRSSSSDQNTAFSTADGDNRLQASLQHVVVNYTPSQGRRIYINGEYTGDMDPDDAGLLNEWDDSFALVMGNETDGNSLWEGTLRMVAIHSRALTESQIQANFDVGVGQKYYLLFSVSDLVNIPESFIVFEVSQFDSYSYLFSAPFFISLDDSQEPSGISVNGMRIGINGKEAVVGQAYANLDMTLDDAEYEPGVGQPLSRLGTIVALEKGPEADEFFLTFEDLNGHEHVRTEPALPAEPTPSNGPETPHIGIKTFDEINASMSRMTGVSVTHPDVAETFATVRQQLPTVETLSGFLASQQMAITQMAIQYCDAMVNDTTIRDSFFPDFNFAENANTAFDEVTGQRDKLILPLLERFVGTGLSTQPTDADVTAELNNLMDKLTVCANDDTCDANRTPTVVKASCAAVLGSAVTVVQ